MRFGSQLPVNVAPEHWLLRAADSVLMAEEEEEEPRASPLMSSSQQQLNHYELLWVADKQLLHASAGVCCALLACSCPFTFSSYPRKFA